MKENEKKIEELLSKAAKSEKSEDAMRFSQAALNCSHAIQVLAGVNNEYKCGQNKE